MRITVYTLLSLLHKMHKRCTIIRLKNTLTTSLVWTCEGFCNSTSIPCKVQKLDLAYYVISSVVAA